jgi:hypothetical protein
MFVDGSNVGVLGVVIVGVKRLEPGGAAGYTSRRTWKFYRPTPDHATTK